MSDNKTIPEIVHFDDELEIIFLPIKTYRFFIANGKAGTEAFVVFFHLIFTAKLQRTTSVWANTSYLKRGTNLGDDRIKRAKAFLKKHGLISYYQDKDPKTGKIKKTYIKVNRLPAQLFEKPSTGVIAKSMENHTYGNRGQMLINKKGNARERERKDLSLLFDQKIESVSMYLDYPTKISEADKTEAMKIIDEGFELDDFIELYRRYKKDNPKKQFHFFLKDTDFALAKRKAEKKKPIEKKTRHCPVCASHGRKEPLRGGVCHYCFYEIGVTEADKMKNWKSAEGEWTRKKREDSGTTAQGESGL